MNSYQLKSYIYKCKCGYEVKVFIDCGRPQDSHKCRSCGNMVSRKEP